jgi:hypothetical protein
VTKIVLQPGDPGKANTRSASMMFNKITRIHVGAPCKVL